MNFIRYLNMNHLKYAIRSISYNKTRTILISISIIIGIANLVAMISISEGLKYKTISTLERLGSDKILVWIRHYGFYHPYEYEGFDEEIIKKISRIDGVKKVFPIIYKNYIIKYRWKKTSSWITCLSEDAMRTLSKYYKLLKGRYFYENKKEVVIGYRIYKRLGVDIGDEIRIFGENFKIVGIIQEIGVYDDDITAFLPLSIAKRLLEEKGYNYLFIISDINNVEKVSEKIRILLKNKRKKEDFVIYTQENLREEVMKILGTITIILITLSMASITIAGIIITNTMLTNVVERTREIGILRAIGADTKDIVLIFLSEIISITFVSTIIGTIFGIILSHIIPSYMAKVFRVSIEPIINFKIILIGIFISIIVSIIFSLYPIYKAVKIKPIDVLRYE